MGNQSSVGLHRENDHSSERLPFLRTSSNPRCRPSTRLPFSSPVWLFVLVRTKPKKSLIKQCARPTWTIASRQTPPEMTRRNQRSIEYHTKQSARQRQGNAHHTYLGP